MSLVAGPPELRPDLSNAIEKAWTHLAQPGATWTSAQRIEIAAEARVAPDCDLCRRRRAALSPYHLAGEHDRAGHLPAAGVDAVHRIVTDPSRLTEAWYRTEIEPAIGEARYVELVGVVAVVVAVDSLARCLGAPLPRLPDPASGAPPTGVVSTAVESGCAWVATVPPELATGSLADAYRRRLTNPWGYVANIQRALTLVPEEQLAFTDLMEAMYVPLSLMGGGEGPRALKPAQLELVAATVSAANGCFY